MYRLSKKVYVLLVAGTCASLAVLLFKANNTLDNFDVLHQLKNLRRHLESNSNIITYTQWSPDWLSAENVSDLFKKRNTRIRRVCHRYESKINSQLKPLQDQKDNLKKGQVQWDSANRVISSSRHKLSVCVVPKVSSTYWNFFMQHLVAVTDSTYTYTSVKKAWKDVDKDEVFAYVSRNPWHRFVSVYIEKMSSSASSEQRTKFLIFCQEFREPPEQAVLSFEQFLECAIHYMESGIYNIHWEPVYLRCDICHHPYTSPVMLENMELEGSFLLNSVGIEDGKSMMDEVRNKTIRKVERRKLSANYMTYYSTLTDLNLISRFRALYNIELELFDYPKTPFAVISPT